MEKSRSAVEVKKEGENASNRTIPQVTNRMGRRRSAEREFPISAAGHARIKGKSRQIAQGQSLIQKNGTPQGWEKERVARK